jgi:hypothetical protein
MEKNNDAQQKLAAPSTTTTMPSMSEKWQILSKIYTNPLSPGGYAGADALFKAVKQLQPRNRRGDKITRKDVIDFLEANRTYSLFKQRRLRFPRSRTVPSGYFSDAQADLAGIIFLEHIF